MGLIDLIDNALTTGLVRHGAQREASKFEATVKPGHTYYSVVDLYAKYPGAPRQALKEWVFSKPGRWIGQIPRHGHMGAGTAWLSYGPLHEVRPPGLMTFEELRNRPDIFGRDLAKAISASVARVGLDAAPGW